jgi:DNA-directed RNA polymerase specialized sigma subunit
MSNNKTQFSQEFKNFAKSANLKIQANKVPNYDQGAHVNTVFALENSIKNSLQSASPERLAVVYQMFITHIKYDVGNILSAQSFFREKKKEFNKISKAIKNSDIPTLLQYHINYNLIEFIKENWGAPFPSKVQTVYNKFIKERQTLIENNLPLAINRALLFYRKTKESNLSLMDLINICVIGLTVGIDKYSGPYSKVWRSVCIGRMTGFMIKEYSETFIKLYPSDRKILYRANMIKYRLKVESYAELANMVNESFKEDKKNGMSSPNHKITREEIESLMNCAHYYSTDSTPNDSDEDSEDSVSLMDTISSDSYSDSIDDIVEKRDLLNKLKTAIEMLDMIPRKVIKLKGVLS